MLRCIEQDVGNISYMHPNQKIKFKDWYMKIDPPMWMAADFECMNVLIHGNDNDNNNDDINKDNDIVHDNDNDDVTDKLFVNKPIAISYNIVKNPDYDNLKLEKDGYIKYFGEDCVEWFINEMLEIQTHKNAIEINLDTIPENYNIDNCCVSEKKLN